jgi:queuosine biosynthesis protein QueC
MLCLLTTNSATKKSWLLLAKLRRRRRYLSIEWWLLTCAVGAGRRSRIVRSIYRNTIFLSFALAYAEAIQASRVYLGVNALDYSGYPDCRPEYIAAMQQVFDLGTKQGLGGNGIQIAAPLINLHKTEIIQLGNRLGVSWADTWSCYDGGELACGVCDSWIIGSGWR